MLEQQFAMGKIFLDMIYSLYKGLPAVKCNGIFPAIFVCLTKAAFILLWVSLNLYLPDVVWLFIV